MKTKFIPVEESFKQWKKDPKYVAAYDALEKEFAIASAMIKARGDANMTQEQVAKAMGTTTTRENWEPTASTRDSASNKMRRQFHKITSRGAYRVWATAMAVKIAPNAPQAAPVSGSAEKTALARRMPGEKQ